MKVEEYHDEQTGVHLTVKKDIPQYPLLTMHFPFEAEITLDEINQGLQRLLRMAGIADEHPLTPATPTIGQRDYPDLEGEE